MATLPACRSHWLPPLWFVWLLGGVLRVALIAYSEWHDAHFAVQYTDVDYRVYTDGARLLTQGQSPFERHTYRYTPLLAALLVPTLSWPWAGKAVFSACDVLLAVVLDRVVARDGGDARARVICACASLLNPLSLAVSTRGNADVLVTLACAAVLWCAQSGRHRVAALLLGAAVHVKLYPIIHAHALLLHIGDAHTDRSTTARRACLTPSVAPVLTTLPPPLWRVRLEFVILSSLCFFLLSGVCYYYFGPEYLQSSYYYHFTRSDTRHNFSIYFYWLYLSIGAVAGAGTSLAAKLAFVPQLVSLLVAGHTLAPVSLPLTLVVQSWLFVAFNKVCTAQYFLWFLGLAPVLLHRLRLRRHLLLMAGAWLAAEFHWLLWAYTIEMRGMANFLPLHLASMLLFAAHIYGVSQLVRSFLIR